MPINDDDLLAAVSGGADSATTPSPSETPPPEETNEEADDAVVGDDAAGDDTGAAADGDADGAAEGDESKDEAAGEEEADSEAGKDEIDPSTGKPYTPEQVEARKKQKEREEFLKNQVEDPINAPIPQYQKQATRERMTKLVGIAKDMTAKFESAQRDRNEIIGMITDTGATAAQYSQALQYLKMVNSRDPEQIKAAINVMTQELAALSRMAGVPVAGVDLLANHPDLKAGVEAKQITAELANEIAAGREQRQHQTQVSRATQQSEQQAQAAHAAGVQALNDIGKQLAAQDPNYRAKAQAVLGQIGEQMRKLPPHQWAQTFLVAYTTYKAPAPPAAAVRKAPVVPKNQPLRGTNPSGGQQKAPGSLEEAINMGIATATRR